MQTANSLSLTIVLALLAAVPCFAAAATPACGLGLALSVTAFPAAAGAPRA